MSGISFKGLQQFATIFTVSLVLSALLGFTSAPLVAAQLSGDDFVLELQNADGTPRASDVYANGDTIFLQVTDALGRTGLAVEGEFHTIDQTLPSTPLIQATELGGGEYLLTHPISPTNPAPDAGYRIDVHITDPAAGDTIEKRQTVVLDNTPPAITDMQHTPQFPTCSAGSNIVDVSALVTDANGIAVGDNGLDEVTLVYDVISPLESGLGSFTVPMFFNPSTGRYEADSIDLKTGPRDRLGVIYRVEAIDVAGNAQLSDTFVYTYDCADPTANAGGSYADNEGSSIQFDASLSSDAVNDIVAWEWDFNEDGIVDSTEETPTYIYDDNKAGGTPYNVSLTVTDAAGHTGTTTTTADISNVKPTAVISGPASCGRGQTITLSAAGSTDPSSADRAALTYSWDLDNDGLFGDATTADIGYTCGTVLGDFLITVKVSDKDGGTDEEAMTITVTNAAPVANAGTSYSGNEGDTITFDGSGSSDPDGGTITLYEWDFSYVAADGFIAEFASSDPTAAFTYTDDFVGEVALRVTDNDGAISDIATAPVTISNVNPEPVIDAPANGSSFNEGDTIQFNSTGTTDDGAGDITGLAYLWDFGDGVSSTDQNPTHQYADDGTFAVTLTVTDDDLGSASTSITLTINNVLPTPATNGPYTAPEGTEITFDASGTTDPGTADTLTYEWDFNYDGTTFTNDATGQQTLYAYLDNGTFTVALRVTDDSGSALITTTATIADEKPTAGFTVSGTPTEGSELTFTDRSTTPVDNIVSWEWDFNYDGITFDVDATGQTTTYTYDDNDIFVVALQVTDDDGSADIATQTLTISDTGPTANFTHNAPQDEGTAVIFTDRSIAGEDAIMSWLWDFGDGASSTEQNPQHPYDDNGQYTVTLTVTDADGTENTFKDTVDIRNAAPSADAGSDQSGLVGQTFDFSGSATDPSQADTDAGFAFEWDFDYDGVTFDVDATGQTAQASYSTPGTFTVALRVADKDNGVSIDTLEVAVSNAPPTADANGPYAGNEGENIPFVGSASSDAGAGAIVLYEWDFDYDPLDGFAVDFSSATEATATNTYTDDGTFTVALRVTDDNDAVSAIATSSVTVFNVAPLVDAGPDQASTPDDVLIFDASGTTDPGTDDLPDLMYTWDFGDGATATGQVVAHSYIEKGIYIVTLTVVDQDGGISTDTLTVQIGDFALAFHQGWNLFSVPTLLEEDDVTILFGDLSVDAILVYVDGDWQPVCGECEITTIEPLFAYWANLNEDAAIGVDFVDTTQQPEVPPFRSLGPDRWEFVGVASKTPQTIDVLLSGVIYSKAFIFMADGWETHIPDVLPFTDIIEPGTGLWVFVEKDGFISPVSF